MAFSFWEYLVFFVEIFTFLYYANEESNRWFQQNSTTLNQEFEYLQKYWSSVLQTWHQKCTSQKKHNDTYYVIAMATLSAPVSFCEKPNISICNLLKWDRGSNSLYTWFPYCLNSPHWIVVSG